MQSLFGSLVAVAFLAGCGGTGGGEISVVNSGTYEATIAEVTPEEEEMHVKLAGGQELKLHFIEVTTLTKNDETVEFSALEKGQKVSVKIRRVGNRLDPLAVKILE